MTAVAAVFATGTGWGQWTATEEAKLIGGDTEPDDFFGYAVAVSGDTVVVGAPGPGSAYVFVRVGASWVEQQKLIGGGGFGQAVSVWNDRIVVGAYDSASVFERSGSLWSEAGSLHGEDLQPDSHFGDSVAIWEDTVLIGAPRYLEPGFNDRGAAYVFVKTQSGWILEGKLLASNPESFDWFGYSVTVHGDTALVGAINGGSGLGEGRAYVFVRNGGTWAQQKELKPPAGQSGGYFGNSVALSLDTALVGIPLDDHSGAMNIGSAQAFVGSGSTWSAQQSLMPSDPEPLLHFGEFLALSDDMAVVGAYLDDHVNGSGNNEGSAYVFVSDGTSWSEVAKLTASDAAPGDQFGYRVGVSGDTAVAGVSGNDGGAYVYRLAPQPAVTYCTAGTSASGCQALLSATGTPSATAVFGFTLSAATVEGQKDGLFFFGTNGQQANPWGNGTSYQCVVPPVVRAPLMSGTGTVVMLCDGSFALDLNALWCPSCASPAKNPGAGAVVQAQLWYRDPFSTSNQTTSFSDAIEFGVAP